MALFCVSVEVGILHSVITSFRYQVGILLHYYGGKSILGGNLL